MRSFPLLLSLAVLGWSPLLATDPSLSAPAAESPPPEPLELQDRRALERLGRDLPRHGVLPLKAPSLKGSEQEWLRYARRLLNVFAPERMKHSVRMELLERRPLAPAISELIPRHRRYRELQALMRTYAQRMGQQVPQLPDTRYSVRVGVKAPEVGILRERLALEGYIDLDATPERLKDYFDDRLKRALQSWQRERGIPVTISLDNHTRRHLNSPISTPISEVALALARFRALDLRTDEGLQLIVHINNFSLSAERNGRSELSMPVVVGKNTDKDQTPALSAPLYAVVANPTWNVPTRLVNDRLKPQAQNIPELLIDKGYEVVVEDSGRWRVKMQPGPDNPLGRLKFLLSDTQSIYLHDTPVRDAFGRDSRTLSAGCVRLEKPQALAQWLLPTRRDELEKTLETFTEPSMFNLGEPIPTHLMYQTVLAESGRLLRFPDIYKRDPEALVKIKGDELAKELRVLLDR